MASTFKDSLILILERELRGFESLLFCRQLSAGASQETWRISAQVNGKETSFALRRNQPTAPGGSSVGGIGLATEARLFTVASQHNIPGPEVLYVLQDADGLGQGFLMQWLDGETLGQRITRSEILATARPKLARQY